MSLPRHLHLVLWTCFALLFAGGHASATEVIDVVSLDEPSSLAGAWSFRTGDDPSWADPDLDDSDWDAIHAPALWGLQGYSGYAGFAWYRLRLVLPEDAAARPVGVTIGRVSACYEIYADGTLLGGVGKLPPDLSIDYDKHETFAIPPQAIADDGVVVLAVRVYKPANLQDNEGGIFQEPLEIGLEPELRELRITRELPTLVLAAMYVVVGLFHLQMWLRRRGQLEYLLFASLVVGIATYSLLTSQWKYYVIDSFQLASELEYLTVFPLPGLYLAFLYQLCSERIPRPVLTYLAGSLIVAVFLAVTPGLALNQLLLTPFQVCTLVATAVGVFQVGRWAYQGNAEARTIGVGILLSSAGITMDILRDFGLHQLPPTLQAGFALMVASMALSLSNRFMRTYRDLDELRHDLERRVEARTDELASANAKLVEQAEQLKELDQRKTNFFQNISHELRTPLQLILGPLAREREAHPESRNLQVAESNSHRLLRLVNQLLEYQKLAADKYDLKLRSIDVREALARCSASFRSFAEERGLTLDLDLPEDASAPCVLADPHVFDQMVFNYLSNACKHTPAGGRVAVGYELVGARIRVFVQDTGPGIRTEDQQRLFKLFSQVDEADTRRVEGTGLGLALVKELAEAHGGTVGVRSDAGAGARFWFELESVDADAAPPSTEEMSEGPGWLGDLEQPFEGVEGARPIPPDDTEWVLVVDDHPEMCRFIEELLVQDGFEVRTRQDPHAARELLESHRPSLIILDWMMPGMSGPQLMQSIREDSRLAAIPIVLVTAKAESRTAGSEAGADGFLGKPFDPKELLSTVSNLLRLKAREKELEVLQQRITHDVLGRFLPPQIAEKVASGELTLEHEPKMFTVTMLFADVAGFTAATEDLRAAAAARFVNEYLGTMADIVFRYGGTMDKFMGDGVMAFFGAPVEAAPAAQCQAAIGAAQAMHQAMAELSARWEGRLDQALTMRIGVHHGPAIVGNFGSAAKTDYTAIGPTVNLAARIESVCEPGTTFVSGVVADYMPESLTTVAGTFQLKGHGSVLLFRVDPEFRAATPAQRPRRSLPRP